MAEEKSRELTMAAGRKRRLPPVGVMGLTYATFALVGGFCAVTVPQILAAEHVPVERIAVITSIIISPGFWAFLIAPMVDIRYRRRTYALVCGVLSAVAVGLTVAARPGPEVMEWVMLVGLFSGVGSVIAGVAGSLLLQPLAKRFALRPLYLGVGVVGAVFTLTQLMMPRSSVSFGVAITGENLFQALAFATLFAIIFEIMGPDNPFSGTIFSLLASASVLPLLYMQVLDGKGYTADGPAGSYLMDASVSVAGCCAMAWMLARWKVMGTARTELVTEAK